MSGFPPAVLTLLKQRSRGLCEGCGLNPATEAHHRQYRSRRGPDTLSNALHLCGWGNHTGCHGIAHTVIGEQRGWSIRSGFNPEEVPYFRIFDGTWWRHREGVWPEQLTGTDAVAIMRDIGAIKEGLAT